MSEQWLAWSTQGKKVDKPAINVTGKWVNPLGSEMQLKSDGKKLTGTYKTAVGAPGKYEEFEIEGTINGDLVAFIVDWGAYGSITAWVGQQTADAGGSNERIECVWHLVKNIDESSEGNSLWGAFLTGFNSFIRAK